MNSFKFNDSSKAPICFIHTYMESGSNFNSTLSIPEWLLAQYISTTLGNNSAHLRGHKDQVENIKCNLKEINTIIVVAVNTKLQGKTFAFFGVLVVVFLVTFSLTQNSFPQVDGTKK